MNAFDHAFDVLRSAPPSTQRFGRVRSVVGLLVEASGLDAALGELCYLYESDRPGGRRVKAEVVG
ncbi:MAG TPA: hypothetical protein VK610_01185, partial [Rhodothermales bacterium]|nr:hypothetical protein [Rhodothermales bacterium]